MKKVVAVLLALSVVFSLAAVAFADDTPSVEKKDITTGEVEGHQAIIELANGEFLYADDGSELELLVTPYADKDGAVIPEITDSLDNSGNQILAANTVQDLTEDMVAALEAVKAASADPQVKALSMEDLIVWDLFDATLVKDGIEYYQNPDGSSVTFAVQTNLRPGDIFFLLHNPEGTFWELVTSYTLDENGLLIITVDTLRAFALIVTAYQDIPIDENAPKSPQTGYDASNLLWFGAGACAAAAAGAAVYGVIGRKKKEEQ